MPHLLSRRNASRLGQLKALEEAQEHFRAQAEKRELEAKTLQARLADVASVAAKAKDGEARARVRGEDLERQIRDAARAYEDLVAQFEGSEKARTLLCAKSEEWKSRAEFVSSQYEDLRTSIRRLDLAVFEAWRRETSRTSRFGAELPARVKALEDACRYFRTQAENWEREARTLARMHDELRSYVVALEKARDAFRARAEHRERQPRSATLPRAEHQVRSDASKHESRGTVVSLERGTTAS